MPRPTSVQSPEPDIFAVFEEEFAPATFARGKVYEQQGRAIVDSVHATGPDEVRIVGRCKGSNRNTYDVSVLLETDPLDGLFVADAYCTCPVALDCKHAVALLLTYARQNIDDPHTVEQRSDMENVRIETLTWLDVLDAPPAVDHADPEVRRPFLVYQLHTTPPVHLSLGKSQALKRGGTSKPARFTLQTYDLSARTRREFIRDEDETPLRLFHALQADRYAYAYESDVPVKGETGAMLLMHAARTGRLFLAGNMQAPLEAGDDRPLDMKWVVNEAAQQQLAFDLPPHVQVLPTWPPHFYDPHTRSVGKLQSALPEALFRKLLLAPPLNESEAMLVRTRMESLARTHKLAIPLPVAIDPELPSSPPLATLTLTMASFRHEALYSLHEQYPIAELHFDYAEGVRVIGSERPEAMTHIDRAGERVAMRRDVETEAAVWQQLQAIGLESYRRRMPRYHRIDTSDDCLITAPADARGWLPLLSDGLEHLAAAGIRIDYADDFPFELTRPDNWFVAIDESEGNDWFDLDLGVIIDGQRVSLVPPLVHLITEQPHLLKRLETLGDTDTLPLPIDARRILPVPAARLRAWIKPLMEFLDDDRPRLSRYHAAALAVLDEQPTQWLGGDELRDLGKRLRDFSGIAEALPAPGFGTTLRGYQQAGLNWLQFLRTYGFAGILADDMGLGKTVQTLAHLQLEKAEGRTDRPSLVIAPTSLLPNWANEARQFAPDLKVLTLHGPDRSQHFDTMREADLILTTYPLLVRDQDVLLACDYHVLVLDEAQFIKNPKAQSHRIARKLKARHRLSLTGTPLENHLGELWAQFDFLMPGFLGNAKRFNETFRTPIEKHSEPLAHAQLSARVAPFMLRRTKEQVLQELPPQTEIVRWVELEGAQRDLYESLRVAFDSKLRQALASQGVGRSQIMILDALLKLRQACCDPRLVKLDSARKLGKRGIAESAKLTELMVLLEELLSEGRRILLFSQFTSMLTLIEAELLTRNISFTKLTGQTRDRDTPVRDFQEGRVPVFMISLKAGGTGLNLTAADTVIHYDPWWNPAVEAQATARAHRIGQDKPVFVYKLLGRGTVEEKILALQDRKRGLADQLLSGSKSEHGDHLITAADLDVLFQPLS